MPRPKQCRRVCLSPDCTYFKPAGVPTSALEEVSLGVDELEAMRLVDVAGLYYEQAAEQMKVSRRTFGRMIDSARKKVAQALTRGMALRIEGGAIEMAEQRTFRCRDCQHTWQLPFGTGRPAQCPQCQGTDFCRADEKQGGSGRGRGGRGGEETTAESGRGRQQRRRRRGAST